MGFIAETLIPRLREIVTGEGPPVVPVLPLAGVIGAMGPMRRGLTLAGLADPLDRAFKTKRLAAVALAINSPGGSPVQSALIAKRIRALAEENGVPVLAFCEDVAASGGYWLAAAADEIFVDENSIVGSIGVVSGGFGFVEAIKKLGVERRMHTAGAKKAMLDPFQPEKKAEVAHLKSIQSEMHASFRAMVETRRQGKLVDDPELFSGAFWTGRRAVELGLADGIGDLRTVLRERYGDKVRMPVIKPRRSWLAGKLQGGQAETAALWTDGLLAAVEERLLWDRFRL